MNQDLQKLNDMLTVMQAQRDSALNANVLAQAELASVRRTLAERDERLKELEAEIAKLQPEKEAA